MGLWLHIREKKTIRVVLVAQIPIEIIFFKVPTSRIRFSAMSQNIQLQPAIRIHNNGEGSPAADVHAPLLWIPQWGLGGAGRPSPYLYLYIITVIYIYIYV